MSAIGLIGAISAVYGAYRVFYRQGIWRKSSLIGCGVTGMLVGGFNPFMNGIWILAAVAVVLMLIDVRWR